MLALSEARRKIPVWKRELSEAFTRPEELLHALDLDSALRPARKAAIQFPFLVPRSYAARMTVGNAQDPLLRQVLPLDAELEVHPGYTTDPVGDSLSARASGLLKKYQGRALLVVTGACAVHCRYCFRRHFHYGAGSLIHSREGKALRTVAADQEITEVILSGGDPLMYDDSGLADLISALESIPHVKRLRLHTRLPIVLPSRVTPELCASLSESRLKTLVVVHANHARELSQEVGKALGAFSGTGTSLLNQSVLLRQVNDDAQTLAALSEDLFDCGVLPYYLHLLDPVSGAAHFEVPESKARNLMTQLRRRLPGYLVPRLVKEIPGAAFKQPML
jgi:EF-P beta-lysylation protein EpmB